MATSSNGLLPGGARRFRVRGFGPRPGPEGRPPGSGGKVLLTVAFVDGEVSAYPFWPVELASYEAAIREAVATQRTYWIKDGDHATASFLAPEMKESAPDRILQALQAGHTTDD